MRDILFKAKRKDNGECIIGNLVVTEDAEEGWETIIIPTFDSNIFTKGVAKGDLGFENWHRVDKKTICQYTGLTDKNGTKIWENDILKGLFLHGMEVTAVVIFKDGAFGLKWSRGNVEEFSPFTSICNVSFEVIGNIFDNPELLKGGAE